MNEAKSIVAVGSTDGLGAALQITKRIPARTVTLKALWCRKDFMLMSDRYREIRSRLSKPMDTCYMCRRKLENGEMMALACFHTGGNNLARRRSHGRRHSSAFVPDRSGGPVRCPVGNRDRMPCRAAAKSPWKQPE